LLAVHGNTKIHFFSSLPVNPVFAAGNTSTIPVPYQFGVNANTFIESAVDSNRSMNQLIHVRLK
jgi:hypothetical protein